MSNTTQAFLTEKVTEALASRYCFFDHGETNYDLTEGVDKSLIHMMFKWEFERATDKSCAIHDMTKWKYNGDELVFCLGEDWNTGIVYYISAIWEGDEGIHWFLSDKERYTD